MTAMDERDKFDIMFYEAHYKDGQCRYKENGCSVCIQEWDDCYTIQIDPPDPVMVCGLKTYYADTLTLMSEGKYLKLGNTRIGVWKDYDRVGKIENETDYDEGWTMTWEKFLPILSVSTLDMKRIVGIHRYVKEEEDKTERHWVITTLISPRVTLIDTYDGDTGKKLWTNMEVMKD
jgi:hypothetical protein